YRLLCLLLEYLSLFIRFFVSLYIGSKATTAVLSFCNNCISNLFCSSVAWSNCLTNPSSSFRLALNDEINSLNLSSKVCSTLSFSLLVSRDIAIAPKVFLCCFTSSCNAPNVSFPNIFALLTAFFFSSSMENTKPSTYQSPTCPVSLDGDCVLIELFKALSADLPSDHAADQTEPLPLRIEPVKPDTKLLPAPLVLTLLNP